MPASRNRELESCLNPVCLARLSRTCREERAVDRFEVSRSVVLESPAIIGEVPEQQLTKTPSAREPHFQPERESSRPVEAFKRLCPGEAQRFIKSQNSDCPRPQEPGLTIHLTSHQTAEQRASVTTAAKNSLRRAGTLRTTSNRVWLG